jgi:hypothetical protein
LTLGELLSPVRRRAAVEEVQRALPEVSERRACRVLGQPRAVQRSAARVRDDEAPLTGRIVELASVYGRYGSPRITCGRATSSPPGRTMACRFGAAPDDWVAVDEWTRECLSIDVARTTCWSGSRG